MKTAVSAPQGLATVTVAEDGSVNIDVPNNVVGAGDYNVTVDPNVTVGLVESTIAMLQQVAVKMGAHQV